MSSSLAAVLRIASVTICLVVIASFTVFAVNQTSSASAHQEQELNSGTPVAAGAPTGNTTGAKSTPHHESSLHKYLDDVSSALTSPFSGVTAGTDSQWLIRGVDLVLVLLVYGFGLGFLARVIRVRL